MIREKKKQEIITWCKENDINLLNVRGVRNGGKARIIATVICNDCGERYDVNWNTLTKQRFPGLCTYCAHKRSSEYHRFDAEKIVNFIESKGYKVLTPIEKIKPIGKNKTYNKSKVEIEDSYGVSYIVTYNQFYNNVDYYQELNDGGRCAAGNRQPSCYESIVISFLDELNIPYKREFKFSNCRGKKRPLPFDFCLNYDKNNKMLIEIDGERHYKKYFSELIEYDKIKDGYCKHHNIPLLRIPYWEFKTEKYKLDILHFINTNMK